MKAQTLMIFLLILAFFVSGCVANSPETATATSPSAPTEPLVNKPQPVEDKPGLIATLQASGATAETGDPVSQPFFTPKGSIIKVNGADVQVFEYESAEAMESEASQVSSDGRSTGTTMVNWMDTPHFHETDRIIVLYVGSDATVLDLLEGALGSQFAGS